MTSPVQVLCEQVSKELNGSVTIIGIYIHVTLSLLKLKQFIVLGASGDLAKKKTYPALFGLYRNGFLPENTRIIGYARTKMSHEDYIKRITQYIKIQDADKLEQFKKMTFYVSGQYDEDASFQKLREAIEQSEKERAVKQKNRVYYMALPPSVFIPVAQGIKRNVYTTEGSNRLVVEKPFGMDSESSAHLGRELGALFTENEVCIYIYYSMWRYSLSDIHTCRSTVSITISERKWSRTS